MDYKSDKNFHIFPHAIQFYFHSQVQINLLLRKSEQQPHSRHEMEIYHSNFHCDLLLYPRQIDSR